MDRQIGNTKGYSGIAGAAVIAGEEPSDFTSQPPLVVLGRIFTGKLTYFDERYGEEYLPPFPDTVMIQLAKGVVASNFGLDDPDLLANEFSYLETSMGPLNKIKYLEKFSEYGIRDAVRDMDYRIMNYRVDQYNPYRIWVDTFARGTRTGPIGNVLPKGPAAIYEAAPEAMVSSSISILKFFSFGSFSLEHELILLSYLPVDSPFRLMTTGIARVSQQQLYSIRSWATRVA